MNVFDAVAQPCVHKRTQVNLHLGGMFQEEIELREGDRKTDMTIGMQRRVIY